MLKNFSQRTAAALARAVEGAFGDPAIIARRDAAIRRQWQAGDRVQAIARLHGLSRQRIEQIVRND